MGYSHRYTQKDREIAQYAMEQTGIEQFADKNLLELSGGERQKVYIAMVIARIPRWCFWMSQPPIWTSSTSLK